MDFSGSIQNPWFLLLSLVGLVVLIRTLRSRSQARNSQSWSGTEGKVIESRLEESTSTDTDGGQSTSYRAVVRYTYTVLGREYSGDRIAFGVSNSNRKPASEAVNRYPAGSRVMVYYDPGKPEQAVLEQASTSGWLQIIAGILLIAAGIFLAIW